MVRAQLDPPDNPICEDCHRGGLAQLGEHLLCKQGVVGSIPSSSTKPRRPKRKGKTQHQNGFAKGYFAVVQDHLKHIGCSLKNHRVESALLMKAAPVKMLEQKSSVTRIFDCVKTNIQTKFGIRHIRFWPAKAKIDAA